MTQRHGGFLKHLRTRDAAGRAVADLRNLLRAWDSFRRTARVVPDLPREAIVPLVEARDVLLLNSWKAGRFWPLTYAQESSFAHAMAARGRAFAVSAQPAEIFGKAVIWFSPRWTVTPVVWDYSRQIREFVTTLESQENTLFCSSTEVAFWENKAHMHRSLDAIGVRTPASQLLTRESWNSASYDWEPMLLKLEHSSGSDGIHYFATPEEARAFLATYPFRPQETIIMQEIVPGAERDLRLTMVGNKPILSASYWRIKRADRVADGGWTSTATRYDSAVVHGDIPETALEVAATFLKELGVRTAGIDFMWPHDDISEDPLVLEFSPYYLTNPRKPERYAALPYSAFKSDLFAPEGYLEGQLRVFDDISDAILDQHLY